MKKIIKKIVQGLGYDIVPRRANHSGIITNVFQTDYSNTVLLSYIRSVFADSVSRNDRVHTNRYTTYLIAEVLKELQFNVDVVDCSEDLKADFSKYSLVIGLGKPLENVLQSRKNNSTLKVIWFGTGCNPLFSNVATLRRTKDFYLRHHHLLLDSSRYIKEDWPLQHEFSDWIILHGSSFARSTYESKNISQINAPVFIYHSVDRTDEEWQTAKKNYLWFGVGGLIHKGLDLVIDAFKELTDCNLHICGDIEREPSFYNYYKPIIDQCPNIIYHGFVDVNSEKYKNVLKICAFIVFPSASEGNSPSVITCMANGGLIPIVPKSADVNLNNFGISIDDLNINSVIKAIKQSQSLTISELKEQSTKITEETKRLNSFDYFKSDFKQQLQNALKQM